MSGPTQVSNVVAEITGGELPHEWILLGAHLDSWDLGTGAQDNGTAPGDGPRGCACHRLTRQTAAALDSIRALGRQRARPARFGDVHQKARTRMRDCIAVLNTDNGAGRPRGWYVNGRSDLREAMSPLAERFRDLRADGLSMDVSCGSDECPFLLEGIPALKLWVDTTVHHQVSDTFDKVDSNSFRAGGAVVAATTHAIADQETRLAPRIGQDAVRQILRTAKLDVDLVYSLWRP